MSILATPLFPALNPAFGFGFSLFSWMNNIFNQVVFLVTLGTRLVLNKHNPARQVLWPYLLLLLLMSARTRGSHSRNCVVCTEGAVVWDNSLLKS